jgi:hypothetical protein
MSNQRKEQSVKLTHINRLYCPKTKYVCYMFRSIFDQIYAATPDAHYVTLKFTIFCCIYVLKYFTINLTHSINHVFVT